MHQASTSAALRFGPLVASTVLAIAALILSLMLLMWILYRGEESHLMARELVEQGLINREALLRLNLPGLTEQTYSADAAGLALSQTAMKPRAWEYAITLSGVLSLLLLANALLASFTLIRAVMFSPRDRSPR